MSPIEASRMREGASAILFDTDGRLLLQLRDDVPHIRDPGKLGLFGGGREGNESFLDCIVREVHEEIGYYLLPERFEFLTRWIGPDYAFPDSMFRGELFLARDVPINMLNITEGALKIVALDELERFRDVLSLPAQFAVQFLRSAKV